MLTKGTIIQRVIGTNKYLVDIPFLNTSGIENKYYEAILSNSPAITEEYVEGDVVIIGFEDHQPEKPIIVGRLFLGDSTQRGFANLESLNIGNSAKLPKDTTIGDISYSQIENLFNKVNNNSNESINAINMNGVDYFPNEAGVVTFSTSPQGDVVGPSSAVDGNIATFDGTTGKLIEDSGIAISSIASDSNVVHRGSSANPSSETIYGDKTFGSYISGGSSKPSHLIFGVGTASAGPYITSTNAGVGLELKSQSSMLFKINSDTNSNFRFYGNGQSTYYLQTPNMSSWTANKTIATIDDTKNITGNVTITNGYLSAQNGLMTGNGLIESDQVQYTLPTTGNGGIIAVTSDIPTSINGMSGGTLTSPLNITGGDSTTASKISLSQSGLGQITDSTTSTLFGFITSSQLTVGSTGYSTNIRGSGTRPTYNGNNLALYSDIGTVQLEDVPYYQNPVCFVATPLINQNGKSLSSFTSSEVTIGNYPATKILENGSALTRSRASDYMRSISGSRYVPTYDFDYPCYPIVIDANGNLYKPQYDTTNGMLLYHVTNPLKIYTHHITITCTSYDSSSRYGPIYLTIVNNSSTAFTASTLRQYVYNIEGYINASGQVYAMRHTVMTQVDGLSATTSTLIVQSSGITSSSSTTLSIYNTSIDPSYVSSGTQAFTYVSNFVDRIV